ncbi:MULTISPECIES: ABC transporter permease [Cetobacterium]|uniref:ABC transporter permease n=1 Tax=Candidatus Cetobacterium colombiensis TaxID=3073100 RepID=A0ABU4W6T2_9FUSO|nr:ABC transporter permease [Candidatus Cetobacterium colombiensis]MDX8335237.1 ABC transporter permease [Candidatus Cetobacterium colombiensis]
MIKELNNKQKNIYMLSSTFVFLIGITLSGWFLSEKSLNVDFTQTNISPEINHIFGTDWMGRDMFTRTLSGLSMSIRIGIITAGISSIIALTLGTLAAFGGKTADSFITWLIDLIMGVPHILLLILISFACGKGFLGVITGVTLTHWPGLARVIRSEVLSLKNSDYIMVSEKLGVSKFQIVKNHMIPHLLPQFLLGLILLFPHAILHEASITFLGFGLSPEQPAIGIILSESMRYLSTGKWWLGLFPGFFLVLTVVLFDYAGHNLSKIFNVNQIHK